MSMCMLVASTSLLAVSTAMLVVSSPPRTQRETRTRGIAMLGISTSMLAGRTKTLAVQAPRRRFELLQPALVPSSHHQLASLFVGCSLYKAS